MGYGVGRQCPVESKMLMIRVIYSLLRNRNFSRSQAFHNDWLHCTFEKATSSLKL